MTRLVLASTSPFRRALLTQAGLDFESVAPEVPEPLQEQGDPREQSRAFALAKARAVAARHPDAVVIGSDQVLDFEGRSFGKAEDAEAAFTQLRRMAGSTHTLVSAIAIVQGQSEVVDTVEAVLTMRALDDEAIRRYVGTGEWQGCAGSYRIEGRGITLFERIDGEHTTIMGLPMPRLLHHLRRFGIHAP